MVLKMKRIQKMKITYNHAIKTLKFVTTVAFVVALGFKLYNIYKYGGPKKPEKPVEPNFEDEDGDYTTEEPVSESYGEAPVTSDKAYSER
jgi:hypothetical protein